QPQPHELDVREGNAHVGAVGADAIGHDGRLLPLHPGQHRPEYQQHAYRVADIDDVDDEVLHHAGATANEVNSANSASASATEAFLGKHGSNALTVPWKLVECPGRSGWMLLGRETSGAAFSGCRH